MFCFRFAILFYSSPGRLPRAPFWSNMFKMPLRLVSITQFLTFSCFMSVLHFDKRPCPNSVNVSFYCSVYNWTLWPLPSFPLLMQVLVHDLFLRAHCMPWAGLDVKQICLSWVVFVSFDSCVWLSGQTLFSKTRRYQRGNALLWGKWFKLWFTGHEWMRQGLVKLTAR